MIACATYFDKETHEKIEIMDVFPAIGMVTIKGKDGKPRHENWNVFIKHATLLSSLPSNSQ